MQDDFGNLISVERDTIDRRLDKGAQRMGRIEGDLALVRNRLERNAQMMQKMLDSTAEIVEFFESMHGAMRVLNWIGKLARPVAGIIGLCAALVALWTAIRGAR